jgi:hypothetical protein
MSLYDITNPFDGLNEMPTENDNQKKAYNQEILRRMLNINAIPKKYITAEILDEATNNMLILIDMIIREPGLYKDDLFNNDFLLKIKAFNDKYKTELMTGNNIETLFGERTVHKLDGSIYKRWGGRTRKYKTFAKSLEKIKGREV